MAPGRGDSHRHEVLDFVTKISACLVVTRMRAASVDIAARSGCLEANGGSGSYSILNWIDRATASPAISATTCKPKLMPEVTPVRWE
jgi:hypothetical protein